MKKILVAKNAGFCFGVKRAVEMVEKALKESSVPVYCLGSLIHNDQVVRVLEQKGLNTVDGVDEIPRESLFVVRSHGVPLDLIKKIKKQGIEVLDATCPFVRKAQITAKDFKKSGYQVIICGDPKHAEVIGINTRIDNEGIIIHDAKEVYDHQFKSSLAIMSQTTQKVELLKETIGVLLDRGVKNFSVRNTICLDSTNKQAEIRVLAKKINAMIVVGGRSSSNTIKLAELSQKAGATTYHIETASELDLKALAKAKVIGIAAGASTADFLIQEVVEKVKNINNL